MSAAQEQILSVVAGRDGLWQVTAEDDAGDPVAFSVSDTPSAKVWAGDDQGVLFSPAVEWDSAPAGTMTLSVTDTQSAVDPGLYRLLVEVLRASDGAKLVVLDAWLSVTEAPGTADPPKVYCTYLDMRDYGGGDWLQTLAKAEGQTNFARERARARSWLDGIIARRYRPWSSTKNGGFWSVSGPVDSPDQTIADKLADDLLVVTDGIKELCALKALEFVCRQRVGMEADDGYAKKAAYFRRLASNRLACTTATIDPDDNGVAQYAIHLGILSIR